MSQFHITKSIEFECSYSEDQWIQVVPGDFGDVALIIHKGGSDYGTDAEKLVLLFDDKGLRRLIDRLKRYEVSNDKGSI